MATDYSGQTIPIGNKTLLQEFSTPSTPPAVAWHKGRFWVAWVGTGNQNLNIVGMDLDPQTGKYVENRTLKRTLNSTSGGRPALASDGERLWMAFIGVGNRQINIVSAVDGYNFDPASKVTLNSESYFGPSLGIFNGKLWIGYSGLNDQDFSIMGPSTDGHFDIQTRQNISTPTSDTGIYPSEGTLCEYQGTLNVIVTTTYNTDTPNNITIFRWQPGTTFPPNGPVILPVKGFAMSAAVHGNDIVGAASIAGDEEVGVYSPIAISDAGVVAIVWSGTDNPSHVNFGILPYVTGR
jgi:hypothetical protein